MKPLVYVVDDEPMLLELTSALLQPAGFEVVCFPSGESAFEEFSRTSRRPKVVITDFAMGKMNGLELIEACRRVEPAQKTFLVSGTVEEDIFHDSYIKPDEFMPKPFHPASFVERVRKLANQN